MRVPRLPRAARYALAVGVALAIGYASVTDPGGGATGWSLLGIRSDKWLHAVAYATLAGSLAYAGLPDGEHIPVRLLAAAAFAALGYGFAIELVQATIAYRTFALADVAANAVGSAVGTAPFLLGRSWSDATPE